MQRRTAGTSGVATSSGGPQSGPRTTQGPASSGPRPANRTSVQRRQSSGNPPPEPPPYAAASSDDPPPSYQAVPAGAFDPEKLTPFQIDELVNRVIDPITRHIRTELRLDRERIGRLRDPRT
ncbi:hypothetical protein [Streptomyces sp. WAC 01438]|uniref:hypothetical protein n=1 Tax=Streptomyces sp. WAC 01438 TaxID=2203204 RepID=UPI000F747A71|nr:hypothetical protein [Streptomyces sp. WAC 01438]